MTVKLLVFDFDGVLGDTFDLYVDAFRFAFKSRNIIVSDELLRTSLGKRMQDIISELIPNHENPEKLISELRISINQYLLSPAARSKYKLRRGTTEFIDILDSGNKVPRVILSNSIVAYISSVLKTEGLDVRWNKILGADSGYESKSHAIQALCEEYKLQPKEVLFVGDTLFDMKEGIDAGVKRIGIVGWHNEKILSSTGPDYLVNNLDELSRIIKSETRR